jgi:hypothetical protein
LPLLFCNDRQPLLQFLLSPFEFFQLKHRCQIGIGSSFHLLFQAHPRFA